MQNKKIKMSIDFHKYLFFLKKSEGISLIVSLIIFLISLISMIQSDFRNIKSIDLTNFFVMLVFLFSLFNVIWNTIEKIKGISSFKGDDKEIIMRKKKVAIKENVTFELKDIKSIKSKRNWDFENISMDNTEENRVMWSQELNEYLWDNTITVEHDPGKREMIQQFILRNSDIITPFFQYKYYNSKKNNQYFFNETKLCMSSDIEKRDKVVRCHKSNYYSSFLTNEISMYSLQRIEDATIIYDASNFYPCEYSQNDKAYYLQSINKSAMNNHIGISSLALTKDNFLVIRKQGGKNQQSKNKYVPTGSGSCDWTDIRESNFSNTITYAMKRELWEENGGNKVSPTIESVGETKILGFFRWLERGGKPEFVGITKLHCNLSAMEVSKEELVNIANKADMDTFTIDGLDDITKVVHEIRSIGNLSLSLYACLDALELFYLKRPQELQTLLKL